MGGALTESGRASPGATRGAFLLFWLVAALYLFSFADERWIPHDEGTLAQSAERVLAGELPHRDFDELYTGGLSAYHALAFALFGKSLLSLRWALLAAVVLLFLPCYLYLARRVLPVGGALLLATIALGWSLPNYFGPLPSWYNLILAVAGTAALARSLDREGSRWRFLAGVCAGLSLLVKSSGLWFVLGACLFLLYDEERLVDEGEAPARARQGEAGGRAGRAGRAGLASRGGRGGRGGRSSRAVACLLTALALVGAGALFALARRVDSAQALVHFALPASAIATWIALDEWRRGGASPRRALARLALRLTPFLAGVALCLLPFLFLYAWTGSLADLWRGLFVLPLRRFELARLSPPALSSALFALPLLALLAAPRLFEGRRAQLALAGLAALALALFLPSSRQWAYRASWSAVRPLGPLLALVGWRALRDPCARSEGRLARRELLLYLSMAASLALIQMPYAGPIYFCYVAPMLALAAAALLARAGVASRPVCVASGLFFALFGLLWLVTGTQDDLGWGYMRRAGVRPLELARGGLSIHTSEAVEYEALIHSLAALPPGATLYAAPDCPEVYFLAGRRNPTATLFEIFDSDAEREQHILAEVGAGEVQALVLNSAPRFSPPLRPEFEQRLRQDFANWTRIGRFEVGFRR